MNVCIYLFVRFKELAFSFLVLLLSNLAEILVIEFLNVDSRNVNLCGSSNHVGLVHTSQGDTIDLEWPCKEWKATKKKNVWTKFPNGTTKAKANPRKKKPTCYKKQTRRKLLEEDNSLALESTGKDDQHCSWSDAGSVNSDINNTKLNINNRNKHTKMLQD